MQNGTHLDMLHETPYCMGIAFESDTAFWAMNGAAGSLDRYDFNEPHEIGGENHADGEVFRYAAGELLRVPEVPSHAVFDSAQGVIYVADTGHARLVSVDPKTATRGGEIMTYEVLRDSGEMLGATVTELAPAGTFEQPSGVALDGDTLYVTDTATSLIYVLSTAGEVREKLATELPAGSLGGITVGPDGQLYFADLQTGAVRRVEPE
jgi:glucose/arabinose dehydrogenase